MAGSEKLRIRIKGYEHATVDAAAARIVEIVSGMPLDQYLEENIFKPLGMKDTGTTSLLPLRRCIGRTEGSFLTVMYWLQNMHTTIRQRSGVFLRRQKECTCRIMCPKISSENSLTSLVKTAKKQAERSRKVDPMRSTGPGLSQLSSLRPASHASTLLRMFSTIF